MRRWASNASVFALSVSAIVVSSILLSGFVPSLLSSLSIGDAGGDEAPFTLVEGSGVQNTLLAVKSLDSGSAGTRANRGLERSLCSSLGVEPVGSVSIAYGNDNASQAVVIALPPGAGTWVAENIGSALGRCLNADTSSVSWLPSWAQSAEYQGSTVIVWSRGDFVVAFDGNPEDAQVLDDVLVSALEEFKCLNISPAPEDHYMNPAVVGEDQYRPPTKSVVVTVDEVPIEDADGVIREEPRSGEIPYPGREAVVPNVPEGREYWPDLPEFVEYPQIPVIEPRPPNSITVDVPVYDASGPGCGWLFFSYQVIESEALTEAEERAMLDAAESELRDKHEQWSAFVGEFWDNYDSYVLMSDEYEAYRARVEEVSAFWQTVVAPLWDKYESDMALWEAQTDELEQWELRYEEAQTEWSAHLERCVEREDEFASPTPAPANTLEPTASPVVYCDEVDEPLILSEQPPTVMDRPERPTRPEEQAHTK